MSGAHFATVILFHNGFGDYIMALPTLRALCAAAPKPICVITGAGPQAFLMGDVGAERKLFVEFTHDWPAKNFDASAPLEAIASCELFVSLCPYVCAGQTQLVEALAPSRALGFVDGFSERLDYAAPGHEIEVLFRAAQRLGVASGVSAFAAPLPFSEAARRRASALRDALGPRGLLLALHLDTRPDKSLSPHVMDAPLRAWLSAAPEAFALAFNMDADDLPLASASGRIRGVRGASLEQAMALAAEADATIGVDSCMLHAADHARRAQLGFFGPTDPERTGAFWAGEARFLRSDTGDMVFEQEAIVEAGLDLVARLRQ